MFTENGPVPEDYEPECQNCQWFVENYNKQDLYMFTSMFLGGWHINAKYGAEYREDSIYREENFV